MTPQQLVGLGLRLLALRLALAGVPYFFAIPEELKAVPTEFERLWPASYTIGGLYFVGALILWFCPMVVAHLLVPRTKHDNLLEVKAYDLARVGCGLMGLWIFVQALPDLVWFVLMALMVQGTGAAFSSIPADNQVNVAVSFCSLLLAVVLIVKNAQVARLFIPLSPQQVQDKDESAP